MARISDELTTIPGIGPNLAADLRSLGYRTVASLKAANPERMYERSRKAAGGALDRCVLYAYRCAVYYASHTKHDPKKLLWWNWKDKRLTR
jgi:hypothetical protein